MTVTAENFKMLPFRQLSRDLYADVYCECGEKKTLIGYSDSHFFDRVNKEMQQGKCRGCDRGCVFQWRREGVLFCWENAPAS